MIRSFKLFTETAFFSFGQFVNHTTTAHFCANNTENQIALAKSLFFHWNGHVKFSSGSCSLVLYKRGVLLSQMGVNWLEHCMERNCLTPSPIFTSSNSVEGFYYEAPLVLYGISKKAAPKNTARIPPDSDGASAMDWSYVMTSMDWFQSSKHGVKCKWLHRLTSKNNTHSCTYNVADDEFYLVVENEKLLAHKSICSAKCNKLAAAIRFHEANIQTEPSPEEQLSIQIDLPLLACKMLLCHIYHGSIVFGLLKTPLKQCDQLLEMALIAEEYLCPSLMIECEMRLLSPHNKDISFACICPHCSSAPILSSKDKCHCPIQCLCLEDTTKNVYNEDKSTLCKAIGVYSFKASNFISSTRKSLITPESALNILAVAQQLEHSSLSPQHSFYAIKYCRSGAIDQQSTTTMSSFAGWDTDTKKGIGSGCVYVPFAIAKMTAIWIMLRDFDSVLNSDSYLIQLFDVEDDNNSVDPSLAMQSQNRKEEDAMLLLQTCLEELASTPFNSPTVMPLTVVKNEI